MRERERRETEREEEKDKDNDRDKDRRKGLNVMDLRPWPPPTLQPGPARLCVPLQYLEESAEVPLVVVFDEHQRWRRRRPLIPPQVRRFHLQRTCKWAITHDVLRNPRNSVVLHGILRLDTRHHARCTVASFGGTTPWSPFTAYRCNISAVAMD